MKFSLPTLAFSPSDLVDLYSEWRKKRVFATGRLKFYRDCIDSRLMLREYVSYRAAQMERRGNAMYEPVEDIARGLQAGKTAADSFKPISPEVDVALIAAYEKNNRLDEGFRQIIKLVADQESLKRLVRKALMAPILYLAAAIGMISFGIPMLVEELGPMLAPEIRTVDQVVLIYFGNFMSSRGLVLVAILSGLLLVMLATVSIWTGTLRRKFDTYFPLFMMYKAYQSAVFLKTLAIQLSVTPKMDEALQQVAMNSSPWQRMYIDLILDRLPHHRLNPLTAFEVGFLDTEMIDSLAIITRKGTAEEAIMIRAEEAGQAAIESIEFSVGILKTATTLIAGLLLVWTAYSLVLGLIKVTMQGYNQTQTTKAIR